MPRYNRVTLMGNVVRDPEIRYVGTGAAVTKFTIAVNRKGKDTDSADYIDIVAWDKLAETSNTYLKKGTLVLIEGRLKIRAYESKSGKSTKPPRLSCRCCRCWAERRVTAATTASPSPR